MNLVRRKSKGVIRSILAALIFFGIVVCTMAILFMASDVRRQINELAGSNTDSAQWTMAQSDVELLAFFVELKAAMAGTGNLDEMRRRFDVFYSRVSLMRETPQYAGLRQEPQVAHGLITIQDFLNKQSPLIDSDNATLLRALPDIAADTALVRTELRRVTLTGQKLLSRASDLRRETAGATLLRIATLAIALVVVLLVMVGVLAHLVRQTQRRAEEQAQTRARLQAIISSSLDAIIVVDEQGRIQDFNGAAQAVFGMTKSTAQFQPIGALMKCGMSPDLCRLGLPLPGTGLKRVEGIRPDGLRFPAECSVAQTQSEDGPILVCFLRDISEQLASEKELVKARDRALAGEKTKADMLAVMSHEMRTPLNGMLGTVELLSETQLTGRQKKFLEIVKKSGDLLLRHVNDVLDVSRLDAGKMSVAHEKFDANDVLREIAYSQSPMAEVYSNQLVLGPPDPSLTLVEGDPHKLRQVLLNLVGNALKFTQNGTVTLEAFRVDDTVVEFHVQDTGIGIAERDRDRIFEDFVTLDSSYGRSSGGTGLGLAISRRMAEALGGALKVVSQEGIGSVFTLSIPLPQAHATPVSPITETLEKPNPKLAPMRILVVEDNEINRFVVRAMLELDGHTVDEAENGKAGVALASARKYDLILMDISMPEMDGTEATQCIRTGKGPSYDVPIFALTAHAQPQELERFEEAGMTKTLTKPLTRGALTAALAETAQPMQDLDIGQIDPSQPNSLIEGLGRDMFGGLLTRYLEETETELARLSEAVSAGTPPNDIAALAHRLAGTSAMFGATGLRAHLIELEAEAKSADLSNAAKLMSVALALWPQTKQALRAL